MAIDTQKYISYPLATPGMDRSQPENQVKVGVLSKVVGADGRFTGGIRKFYGMKLLYDLATVTGMTALDDYGGPSFFRYVEFQKRGTSILTKGFVIRWDSINSTSDQRIDLVYTEDSGTTWTKLEIWNSGNSITSTTKIDCCTDSYFLYVFVEGKAAKTVYFNSTYHVVDMGPGSSASPYSVIDFSSSTSIGEFSSTTAASSASHYLDGSSKYQFAFRFYSTVRKIYSAMSTVSTVVTSTASSYKVTAIVPLAKIGAAWSLGYDQCHFYRSITLAGSATAILYKEGSSATYNSLLDGVYPLTYVYGTILDDALPFFTSYSGQTDSILSAIPQSGVCARYEGLTLAAQSPSVDGGFGTYYSSILQESAEYFSTYNLYKGEAMLGRPVRYIPAGDCLFLFTQKGIVHIKKIAAAKPLQFTVLHRDHSLVSPSAVHPMGNSVFYLSSAGLMILSSADGTLTQLTAVDRTLLEDWAGDLSTIQSAYDGKASASYFLNSSDGTVLTIYHSTQTCSMWEAAPFTQLTSGTDILTGQETQAYFITAQGRVVYPDLAATGSGTMTDLSATTHTLNGTFTESSFLYDHPTLGEVSGVKSTIAKGTNSLIGSYIGITSGAMAGELRKILGVGIGSGDVDTTYYVSPYPGDRASSGVVVGGDTFAISPVVFKIRGWRITDPDPRRAADSFIRWVLRGITLKLRQLSGFTTPNPNLYFRCGAYRNNATTVTGTCYVPVSTTPTTATQQITGGLDGIDIEPYVEQISSGTKFELTNIELDVRMSESRKTS